MATRGRGVAGNVGMAQGGQMYPVGMDEQAQGEATGVVALGRQGEGQKGGSGGRGEKGGKAQGGGTRISGPTKSHTGRVIDMQAAGDDRDITMGDPLSVGEGEIERGRKRGSAHREERWLICSVATMRQRQCRMGSRGICAPPWRECFLSRRREGQRECMVGGAARRRLKGGFGCIRAWFLPLRVGGLKGNSRTDQV